MLCLVGGRLVGSVQFVKQSIVSAGGDLLNAGALVNQIFVVVRIGGDRSAVAGDEVGAPDHRIYVNGEIQRNAACLIAGLAPVCACTGTDQRRERAWFKQIESLSGSGSESLLLVSSTHLDSVQE